MGKLIRLILGYVFLFSFEDGCKIYCLVGYVEFVW